MWIITLVSCLEDHPYLFCIGLLFCAGGGWLFWYEYQRPSYKQQREVEDLVQGFDKMRAAVPNESAEES